MREKEATGRRVVVMVARRRCELRWRVTEGPLMDSPVRPYVWPSKSGTHVCMYVHPLTLTQASARRRAEGGSINNSLVEPSISSRRYDEAVDRPRDYTRRDLDFLSGEKKYWLLLSRDFPGIGRADSYPRKCNIFPEIRVNVCNPKVEFIRMNIRTNYFAVSYNLTIVGFWIRVNCLFAFDRIF